jgi:hypothetical protein
VPFFRFSSLGWFRLLSSVIAAIRAKPETVHLHRLDLEALERAARNSELIELRCIEIRDPAALSANEMVVGILVGIEAREAAAGGDLVDQSRGSEQAEVSIHRRERKARRLRSDFQEYGFCGRVIVTRDQRTIDETTLLGGGKACAGASRLEAGIVGLGFVSGGPSHKQMRMIIIRIRVGSSHPATSVGGL